MRTGDIRDSGAFELWVMLGLAGLAFFGAPYYTALAGAILLTISTLLEYGHLRPRIVKARATRLMVGGVVAAATLSLAFATLCYAIGRFFAWLIAV